jgi:hypothetical protein
MVANDSKAAIAWGNQLPQGEGRNSYMAGVASGLAQNGPEEATKFVMTLAPGPARDQATLTVVSRWASSDPKAAMAWVSALPESTTRSSAIQTAVSSWANQDPARAGEWLAALPPGKDQDRLIQSYVSSTSSQYPEYAAPMTAGISDVNQRYSSIETVARQWLQIDPKAAGAWLATTPLPDDRKARLLNPGQPPARTSSAQPGFSGPSGVINLQ